MSDLYASPEIPGIANTGVIIIEDALDNPDLPHALREVIITIRGTGRKVQIRLNQDGARLLVEALNHIYNRHNKHCA